MSTINFTDDLFATVTQQGSTIVNMHLNGMTSFADVIRSIHSHAGGLTGYATLSLRNASQGWRHNRAIMFV